jgi:hypothetical protein
MKVAWVPAAEIDSRKGLRAEDYIPSVLIERVKKVLARGISQHSKINGKALKAKKVYFDVHAQYIVARLADDTWCGIYTGRDATKVSGCINGYNLHARQLMEPLQALGLVTKKEARAFVEWHRAEDAKQRDDSAIAVMKATAEKHGYEVTKKEKK